MNCNKCGLEILDGAKFCPNCGEKISNVTEESNNSQSVNDGEIENSNGENPENATEETIANSEKNSTESNNHPSKNKKKYTIIGIVSFIVILVIATAISCFIFFEKPSNNAVKPVVYETDSELVVIDSLGNDKSKTKTIKISDDYAGRYCFSENNKYIVYSENEEDHDDDYDGSDDRTTFDIYCKKIGSDEEGTLIAKNASSIDFVSGDIEKIYYGKNDDIYYADSKGDSTKLAKDAYCSEITKDKKFAFSAKYIQGEYDSESDTTGESSYDLKYVDLTSGDIVKICDSASNYSYNENNDVVYYTKNNKLYVSDVNGKETAISKDVVDYKYTQSGKVYYLCVDKEYTYYDFVEDSFRDSDNKITEPVWDDYAPDQADFEKQVYDDFWQEYTTQTDYEAYDKAYENAETKYESDRQKYEEACERIELREELMSETDYCSYTLYCFSGSESNKIAENICEEEVQGIYDWLPTAEDKENLADAVTVYTYNKPLADLKKISISKVTDCDDVDNYIAESLKPTRVLATDSGIVNLDINKKGLTLYSVILKDDKYILSYSRESKNEKDLDREVIYTLPKSAKSIDEASLLVENVYGVTWINNKLVKFTDYNSISGTATMEYDNQQITDVEPDCILQKDGETDFIYATDYDEKTRESSVYYYSNGKSNKIADDIYFDSFTQLDGKYLALTDYDDDDGTLICIDGDNQFEIDSNVERIHNNGFISYYCISVNYEY